MRLAALVLTFSIVAAEAGCAANPVGKIYRGHYEYNFEYAIFTPEGTSERWCTVGDMSKAEVTLTYGSAEVGRAEVTLRGEVGPKGKYGNLGSCSRQVTVLEIVDARCGIFSRSEEKCVLHSPASP